MTFGSKEGNSAVDLNVIRKCSSYTLSIAKEEKYDQNSSSFDKCANSAGNLVLQIQLWKGRKQGWAPTFLLMKS